MRRVVFVFLLTVVLGAGGLLRPAASAPTPTATPSNQPAEAIPFADISSQAFAAQSTLRDVDGRLRENSALDAINATLPEVVREVDSRSSDQAHALRSRPSDGELRKMEGSWRGIASNLAEWKKTLGLKASEVDQDAQTLDGLRATWQKTQEVAHSSSPAAGVELGIQDILDSVSSARVLLSRRQGQIFALQTLVLTQDGRVTAALRALAQARNQAVSQILHRDAGYLWDAPSDSLDPTTALGSQADEMLAYLSRQTAGICGHVLLFLLLGLLLNRARQKVRTLVSAEPELLRATQVFAVPWATALMLSLLFGHLADPSAPPLLIAILGAIALFPSIVILRRLVEPFLYPALHALVLFYFLDQARSVLALLPLLARLILLAESAVAILFVLWFAPRVARANPSTSLKVALRGVLLLFILAFLANGTGFVSLALLLVKVLLGSAYLGVILYGLLKILDGLLALAARSRPLVLLRVVKEYRPLLHRRVYRFLVFLAWLAWLRGALDLLSMRMVFVAQARSWLGYDLGIGLLAITPGKILAFGLVLWGTTLLSRFLRFVLQEEIYPHLSLSRGVPYTLTMTLHYVLLFLGVLAALAVVGVDTTKFTVVAGAFSVGIGFGLQNIVNNFVSGLILLYERPVSVGDVIKVGDSQGELKYIGLRHSTLIIGDGSEAIIPNADLISQKVTNWSAAGPTRRIEVKVSVTNDSVPERVTSVLLEVAAANSDLDRQPSPEVLLQGFAGKNMDFELRAWVADARKATAIRSRLSLEVYEALREAEIPLS